jgi:hypothetical protein
MRPSPELVKLKFKVKRFRGGANLPAILIFFRKLSGATGADSCNEFCVFQILKPKLSDFMRRSIGIFWPSGAWANAASIKGIHFTFAQAPKDQNLLKSHPQQSLNLG